MNTLRPTSRFGRVTTLILGLLLGSGLGRVAADDTEIFFPREIIQDGEVVKPNLLFMMDTSGSMAGVDTGENTTRLRRMQDALGTLLDSLGDNVKVGLGRLSGSEGGAILFPVSEIDALVRDVDPTQQTVNQISRAIGDDVAQYFSPFSGTATFNTGSGSLTVGSIPNVTSTSRFTLALMQDEAEEYNNCISNCGASTSNREFVDTATSTNDTTRTSTDIDASRVNDNPPNQEVRYVGLRYRNFSIPSGASITSAHLEFTCLQSNVTSYSNNIRISGHDVGNSNAFSRRGRNISDRLDDDETNNTVNWRPGNPIGACTATGTKVQTPDISSIVEEIMGSSGWDAGDAVTLILTLPSGSPTRRFASLSAGSQSAPNLVINYEVPNAGDFEFGTRFPSVMIPQGVQVTSAFIRFKTSQSVDEDQAAAPLTATIGVENSSNAAAYTDGSNFNGRSSASSLSWSVPIQGSNAQEVTTVDISSLINNRVADPNWCGGNALSFKFTTSDAALRAFVGDNSTDAPILVYNYAQDDAALDTGCSAGSSVRQVPGASSNAQERVSNGAVTVLGNTTLYLGSNNAGTAYTVLSGVRFENINLPRGAHVVDARIEFTANAADSGSVVFQVAAENVGNSSAFSADASSISNRSRTATTSWTPTSWAQNSVYTTSNLASAVQTVLDRGDWNPRNAMSFIITGNNATGRRRAYSFTQSPSRAPKLFITVQAPVGKQTVRQYLKKLVEDFVASGNTPVPEFLYEGASYWRGEQAVFGKTKGSGASIDDGGSTSADYRISGSAAFTTPPSVVNPNDICAFDPGNSACADQRITGSATYQSPLTDQACATNSMILLSDGQPNSTQASSRTAMQTMVGKSCAQVDGTDTHGGTCAAEIAEFLFTQDQSSALEGDQKITTNTIGLADLDSVDFLTDVAEAGGGSFYAATSSNEILNAFNAILQKILDIPTTFVAPAVTVDSFNRLTDRNEIYFALFRPQSTTRWQGNFKRYKIGARLDENGTPTGAAEIQDVNGDPAVDTSTGFFKTDAESFWNSGVTDGDNVSMGGIVTRFSAAPPRKFYTYTGTLTAADAGSASAPSPINLTASSNALIETNNAITKTLLGDATMTDAERTELIRFSRGIDVFDENGDDDLTDDRLSLGDPLHSEPALVTYNSNAAGEEPDVTAYFGTNEGALHAIDVSNGNELFAFVPQELLPNLTVYGRNSGNYQNRPYGVDGPITPLVRDSSGKHHAFFKAGEGQSITLFVGLRRGGRQYYAMDVTDRAAPKIKFIVRGGVAGKYRELGQSWSKPVPARIRFGSAGAIRSVVVVSGGYDPNQDGGSVPISNDNMGRALFIMDSATGERLWWGGISPDADADQPDLLVTEMTHSVPATPKVVDLNGDGLADRIYIVDVSGQVFRFDLNDGVEGATPTAVAVSAANLMTYLRVADLGGTTEEHSRRFYQSPDIALIKPKSGANYLTIAMGSGYRAHPLNKLTQDRFYVLKDPDVTNSTTKLAMQISADGVIQDTDNADLVDTTNNVVGDGSDAVAAAAASAQLRASRGYYIRLQPANDSLNGEKVLTDAQTFDGKILFASYIPEAKSNIVQCQASAGLSRFYVFNIEDGQPLANYDTVGEDDELTRTDRFEELEQGGLPPNPVLLFPTISGPLPDNVLVCVGAECLDPEFNLSTNKTYWIKRQ